MKVSAWLAPALLALARSVDAQASMRVPLTRACSQRTQLCYAEYMTTEGAAYRVAVPSNAVAGQPYDVALQIVAPRTMTWAAIGWGGSMVNNPLIVGYPNGQNITVSPRWTTGYKQPVPYDQVKITTMPDQGMNATHWTLSILCSGCSLWKQGSYNMNLNPSALVWMAVATNSGRGTVTTPSSLSSDFVVHDWNARFGFDMPTAKQANFDAIANQVRPKSETEPLRRRRPALPPSGP